jgi:hypothetical protein
MKIRNFLFTLVFIPFATYAFSDINITDWYTPYIQDLQQKNVIDPNQAEFRPHDFLTREEAVKLSIIGAKINLWETTDQIFSDVDLSRWSFFYIQTAHQQNLVQGFSPHTERLFKPTQPITRAEFNKIAIHAFKLATIPCQTKQTACSFEDTATHWGQEDIFTSCQYGIVNGDQTLGGNPLFTFRPDDQITRAEAAKIISNLIFIVNQKKCAADLFIKSPPPETLPPEEISPPPEPIAPDDSSAPKNLPEIQIQNEQRFMYYRGELSWFQVLEQHPVFEKFYLDYNDPIPTKDNLKTWIKTMSGINLLSLSPFDTSGHLFLESPTLERAGLYKLMNLDLNRILFETLSELKIAYELNLDPLAALAYQTFDLPSIIRPEYLSTEYLADFFDEFDQNYGRYNVAIIINTNIFTGADLDLIYEKAKQYGYRVHGLEIDYSGQKELWMNTVNGIFPYDSEQNILDRNYLKYISEYANPANLGEGDLVYGLANAFNNFSRAETLGQLSSAYFSSLLGITLPEDDDVIRTSCLTSPGRGYFEAKDNFFLRDFPSSVPEAAPRACLFLALREPSIQLIQFTAATHLEDEPSQNEIDYLTRYDYQNEFNALLQKYGNLENDPLAKKANIILVTAENQTINDIYRVILKTTFPTVSNALHLAGFRTYVSYNTALPEADLYYILAPAAFGSELALDLPLPLYFEPGNNLASRINTARIFYHPLGDSTSINLTPRWHQLITTNFYNPDYLEIQWDAETPQIPTLAAAQYPHGQFNVKYRGISYAFYNALDLAGKYLFDHYFIHIPADSDQILGEVVVRGEDEISQENPALVIQNNNLFLVNGSHLHLEFSTVLANLFATQAIINEPGYYYGFIGQNLAVFFAAKNTVIDINLPGNENQRITAPKWSLTIIHNHQVTQLF